MFNGEIPVHSPQNVIQMDPRLFLWTMGVLFSNIAVHLIIAQMSSTRSETINKLLQIYLAIAGLAISGILGEKEFTVFKVASAFFTLSHVYYGICLVCF